MALINTLREKMGPLIVIAVGICILAFIAADLLGPNSALFGSSRNEVGEISGETITIQEYQSQVEELRNNYQMQTNRTPSENEMTSIRQQAWDFLIVKKAFQKQYDELGIEVTDDEVVDMVQGNNIHPELVQAFTNPETGEFDKNQVLAFLQNVGQAPEPQQAAWFNFERSLHPSRLRIKYDNLLLKTNYVTAEEAKREYQQENTVAEVKYLYVPFYSISDTAINVTEAQLKDYIKENSEQYQIEDTRSIKYITFPIQPLADDSLYFKQELERLKTEFKGVEDDSAFARLNTDGTSSFQTLKIGQLPKSLQSNATNLTPGDVRGPYYEEGSYRLFKVSAIDQDTVYSAKASHILFKADPADQNAKAAAKKEAENILKEIRSGASFEEMARQHSDDPSASRGGDLGWFPQGRMVQPFEDAVFGANSEGLVNRVVETNFGYHIIKVTAPKTNLNYKIATIEREITPSETTRNQALRKADYFAATSKSEQDFIANAEKDGLQIQEATRIEKDARSFGNFGNTREMIRWMFTEASKGDVSSVFEVENNFVVAVVTGETEKGTADLEAVQEEVTTKVRNKLKAEQIIKRLKEQQGTLEELATKYGADAKVYNSSDLKLNSNTLPNVGFAPAAVGKAFALKQGERSKPVIEDNGVLVMELLSITEAPEIADYTSYKNQVQQKLESRASFDIMEAIKENAEIEDYRYKFF